MGHREKMKTGDEYDALTGWRWWFSWHPGQRRRIKRRAARRARCEGLRAVRAALAEASL